MTNLLTLALESVHKGLNSLSADVAANMSEASAG
jgi:hypothetical protein